VPHYSPRTIQTITALALVFFCRNALAAGKPFVMRTRSTMRGCTVCRAPHFHDPTIVYYADTYADHYGLPRELIHAFITTESGWNPAATSNIYKNGQIVGHAMGLMQLLPGTAALHGVKHPYSIQDNIGGACLYLAQLMHEFHGDLRLVSASYFSGTHYSGPRGLRYSNAEVAHYVRTIRANYLWELSYHSNHLTR